tara:strand:+ start:1668 stop:3266 length:1599 start_codon:yes stop_codon:yes gene_type:complete
MIINNKSIKVTLFLLLGIFSISINSFYGNIGIFPIDTLGFFDTAYSILLDKHPFRDFWIFTGPLVDYIQAIFFKLFGLNWSSYVLHASVFNLLISLFVFFTLNKQGLNIYFSFFYSLLFSVLCYPVAGTPFAYHHAFILSLISLLILTLAIKTKSDLYWFLLPIFMVLAFFSQQVPSSYINIIIIIFGTAYFIKKFDKKNFYYFISGCLLVLFLLVLYFIIFEIPIKDFIVQYILFPLTIGAERYIGGDRAFISIESTFTFRGTVHHFKFIHVFILSLMLITFSNYFKKTKFLLNSDEIFINLILISSAIIFIFHQLITANQTYIFSLISLLAGFVHLYLSRYYSEKKIIQLIVLFLVIFTTIKYHQEYNTKRKFMDLQKADLTKALDANLINPKLNKLKWITPHYASNPEKEINLLKNNIKILKQEKRVKMVITSYQFFSLILEEDLNIPNRWNLYHGNIYPIRNNKYVKYYKEFFNKNLKSNNVEVIYIIKSKPNENIKIEHFAIHLNNICLKSEEVNELLSIHEIQSCN